VPHYVPKNNIFTREIPPNVDEGRFKQFMRMNWPTSIRSDLQLSVNVQLMIVLYRHGSYGEGSSIVNTAFFLEAEMVAL